jgi:phosphopantetheine--protein transferase-like protein
MVVLKDHAPYTPDLEHDVLLNPLARTVADSHGSFSFPSVLPAAPATKSGNAAIASKLVAAATAAVHGVGTDVELISAIPADNETFLARNFTDAELAYCRAAPDFRASLAARWGAKEATFKSLKVESKGAAASMKEIEVVATATGPTIQLHGEAKKMADGLGVSKFEVSLSHSDDVAVAVVIASA